MKKTFLCVAVLLCLLCTFVLTGCPREPEEEPYKPWTCWTWVSPHLIDADTDGFDEHVDSGDFHFDCSYHFENGDYCSFHLEKRINNTVTPPVQYGIWFEFQGNTGDWTPGNSADPYFDKAYFENSYEQNDRCSGEYTISISIPQDAGFIDKIYQEPGEQEHVYLSEWLPFNGNYAAGDEWVMKFESDAHSERNRVVTVPADVVAKTMNWINSDAEMTWEILQTYERTPPEA